MQNLAFNYFEDQIESIDNGYNQPASIIRLSYLYTLDTKNDLFNKLVNTFYSEIQDKIQKKTHKLDLLKHISSFLLFCFVHQDKEIKFPKDSNKYISVKVSANQVKKCRYFGIKGYSYKYTMRIIQFLENNNFIKMFNQGNIHKESSFIISDTLIEKIMNTGVKVDYINQNFELIRIKETSAQRDNRVEKTKLALLQEYKDNKGKYLDLGESYTDQEVLEKFCHVPKVKFCIDYKDTIATNKMRTNVQYFNSELSKYDINLPLSDTQIKDLSEKMTLKTNKNNKSNNIITRTWTPDLLQSKYIYRSFSANFKHGGRFYGAFWLESNICPKEFRKLITINNEATVELDYSAIHPSILYALEKLPIPNDIYNIPGYDSNNRGIIKSLILLSLNCKSEKSTMAALNANYSVDHGSRYTEQIPDFSFNALRILIDTVKAYHQPISKYLFSGIGLQLQHMDSCLMEAVLKKCFNNNCCALPIHDSILVPKRFQDYAYNVMSIEFQKMFGQIPIIKIKNG